MTNYDYLVFAIARDSDTKRISHVKVVHPQRVGGWSDPIEMTSYSVAFQISLLGKNVATMIWKNEKYYIGERVEVVEREGVTYLRTNPNQTENDNLGELPEYQRKANYFQKILDSLNE